MRALTLLHRWLGIPFCLLFAMWFASGIVMHLVPFPSLTDAEHFAGLAPLDVTKVLRGVDEAIRAAGAGGAARVRLLQRIDGPVYVVSSSTGLVALHAADLGDATVRSNGVALAVALDHARRRGLEPAIAQV